MKGISISPHILPLKPHPFTPLGRLGIPQTLIEAVENLVGFSACVYSCVLGFLSYEVFISQYCHPERKIRLADLKSKNS